MRFPWQLHVGNFDKTRRTRALSLAGMENEEKMPSLLHTEKFGDVFPHFQEGAGWEFVYFGMSGAFFLLHFFWTENGHIDKYLKIQKAGKEPSMTSWIYLKAG